MNLNTNWSGARSVNVPQRTAPLHFPIYFPPAHPVPLLHCCSVQHPPGLVTHFSTQSSPLALLPVAGSLGNGARDRFSTKMSGLCHNFFVWWVKAPGTWTGCSRNEVNFRSKQRFWLQRDWLRSGNLKTRGSPKGEPAMGAAGFEGKQIKKAISLLWTLLLRPGSWLASCLAAPRGLCHSQLAKPRILMPPP